MNTWQIAGTIAQLQSPQLSCSIDMKRPQRGLHELRLGSNRDPFDSQGILQLRLPGHSEEEELRDHWIRGNDFVVDYAITKDRPSQPEIYWRFLPEAHGGGIELIVSVQTGVLDDYPAIEVTSELPVQEVWWLAAPFDQSPSRMESRSTRQIIGEADGAGLVIARLANAWSYVEMVFPSDFCKTQFNWSGDRLTLQTTLFPERLEKGVIRRGRIRGYFMPSKNDHQVAAQLYQSFAKSDPPLTT